MMSKSKIKLFTLLLVSALLIALVNLSIVYSAETDSKNVALDFVETVLPLDVDKYEISQSRYYSYLSMDPNVKDAINEEVTYLLTNEQSKLEITCKFQNNLLWSFRLNTKEGTVIYNQKYSNILDITNNFLARYGNFAEKSSNEMINLLSKVDSSKNMTVKSENTELTVENLEIPDLINVTSFCWANIYDGVEYTSLKIYFENGNLHSMIDDRGLYTIGNTDVLLSKDEAVKIAMKRIESYSYTVTMGEDDSNLKRVEISDFAVNEDRTTADLYSAVKNSATLYPYWSVILNLNQTYPGSVYALIVGIWADSGEVFLCNTLGASGSQLIYDSNSQTQSVYNQGSLNSTYLILTLLAVIFVVVTTTYQLRKRKKK